MSKDPKKLDKHPHPSNVSFSSYANTVRNFSVISGSIAASGVSSTLNARSPNPLARLPGAVASVLEYTSRTRLLEDDKGDTVAVDASELPPNTRRGPRNHDGTPTLHVLPLLSLINGWSGSTR